MTTKVVFHAGCNDGFAAAWAAWKYLGDDAKYIPMSYHDDVPEFDSEDEVYVVDFSFKPDVMFGLQAHLAKFVVIDHHKTIMNDLEESDIDVANLPCLTFDVTRSGCALTWDYFFPGEELPKLLYFIEDRDLWRWEYKYTKAAHLMLSTTKFTFDNFDALVDNFQFNPKQYLDIGTSLGAYEDKMVQRIASNVIETNFLGRGYVVPVVNSPVLQSEVGHYLCENYDTEYAVMWWDDSRDRIYSLRSEGEFDVGELARIMGGGGHKNAAGFVRKGYGN